MYNKNKTFFLLKKKNDIVTADCGFFLSYIYIISRKIIETTILKIGYYYDSRI